MYVKNFLKKLKKGIDKLTFIPYNINVIKKEVIKMTLDSWLENINKIVENFIHQIDKEYNCELGSDFCVYLDKQLIHWSILCQDETAKAFYQNFILRFPQAKELSIFTLSILHEVGHLETENEMIDDTNINTDSLTNEKYFALYNEKIATDWAGEWIEQNYNKAINFNKIIEQTLQKGYTELIN